MVLSGEAGTTAVPFICAIVSQKIFDMKKLVLTFGIIGGLVVSILMALTSWSWIGDSSNFDMGETVGYISIIVSLSVIFFGIKNYRDKYLDGIISFGKAFKVGILISLLASSIYVASWMVYYSVSEDAQKFPELYMEYTREKLEADNTPRTEIDEQMADMEDMFKLYENPVGRAGMTMVEIFPVGLVITLLSSFLLKQKN